MIQHFPRVMAAGKSDCQFLRINFFYSVSIGLIKAGITVYFVEIIYTEIITRRFVFNNVMLAEYSAYGFLNGKIFSIYLLFSISNSFSGCNNMKKFFSYQWNPLLFQHSLKGCNSVIIDVEIARLQSRKYIFGRMIRTRVLPSGTIPGCAYICLERVKIG